MPRPAAKAVCAAAVLACAVLPARAQDHPPYLPTHDVSVLYAVTGSAPAAAGRPPQEARLYWSAELQRARLEAEGRPGFVILDFPGDAFTLVLTQAKFYVRTPLHNPLVNGLLPGPEMQFSRVGPQRVAGRVCTVWHVKSPEGAGTACITGDGVILAGEGRNTHGVGGSVHAIAVEDAPQPRALFAPPPGFQTLQLPLLPGQGTEH